MKRVRRNRGTEAKKSSGLPVGLIPGTEYSQTVVAPKPSDLLVLYTDGISEAGNETAEELAREQLLDSVRRAPVDPPRALGEDLLQRLDLFRGKIRNDHETLLLLQREEEPSFHVGRGLQAAIHSAGC